jgi:hypothetical protein
MSGKGGDISFCPGKGAFSPVEPPTHGSLILLLPDGTEFMKVAPDGSVTVRGNLVATDYEVYLAFRSWLCTFTTLNLGKGEDGGADAAFTPNPSEAP